MMLVLPIILMLLLGTSRASSTSSCIRTTKTVPVPLTVETEISLAEVSEPSLMSIGTVISTFELSSPLYETIETVIEQYEHYYSTLVSELESIYSDPSLYTDLSFVTALTTAHSTLATAVSELISAERTHLALASCQQQLQSAEVSYSTILTALAEYTDAAYPSVLDASAIISIATLTNPSIFASVAAVETAVAPSSTVSLAVSYLSSAAYSLPSTVVTEVLTLIKSPSTVAASTVARLESCYSTLYSQVSVVTEFTDYYPSVASALTAYLSAASSVASLGAAVSTIITEQMPTFAYEVSVLESARSVLPALSQDLSKLDLLTAESPSLGNAERKIEATFYSSPSAAASIYQALYQPSLETDPTEISVEEASHLSFVSAIETVLDWESYYSSDSSTLHLIDSQLATLFATYRTLLSAFSYVEAVTSPSAASASAAVASIKDLVSDLTYVLAGISYITDAHPSLSCIESRVAYYAKKYPTAAVKLWSAIENPIPKSEVDFYEYLIAEFPQLASILWLMSDYESAYSSLVSGPSLESSFIYAASLDSSILSQYSALSYESEYHLYSSY